MRSMKSLLRSLTVVSCLSLVVSTGVIEARTQKAYGDAVVKDICKVNDGDTIKVNIAGYPPLIGENVGIRFYGIDTPPVRTRNKQIKQMGLEARAFVVQMLNNASVVTLKNMKRGKYFRIIAEVLADGVSVTDALLKKGLGVPYFGGKKPDWEKIISSKRSNVTTSKKNNVATEKKNITTEKKSGSHNSKTVQISAR